VLGDGADERSSTVAWCSKLSRMSNWLAIAAIVFLIAQVAMAVLDHNR
jgi:hypothetical protein